MTGREARPTKMIRDPRIELLDTGVRIRLRWTTPPSRRNLLFSHKCRSYPDSPVSLPAFQVIQFLQAAISVKGGGRQGFGSGENFRRS